MPQRVRITDVAPRDGLQNEPRAIATRDKAQLVRLLADSGVDEIEVSSFVSPRWIPQLGDAAELFAMLGDVKKERGRVRNGDDGAGGPIFSALVPNERGLDAAMEVNQRAGGRLIDKVSVFTAASETFSMRNTNATIADSLKRIEPVVRRAREGAFAVRGYVSCVFACPFEGEIGPGAVRRVAEALVAMGVDEIDFGDTIGAATPETTRGLLESLSPVTERMGQVTGGPMGMVLHLHDTFGNAAACVGAALDCGIRSFDGSAAGLGGCPYASANGKRAPGNIATETLVRAIESAGDGEAFVTGIDLDRLASAAAFAQGIVLADPVEPNQVEPGAGGNA
jgi:hydroxymethylglutaryl-CoA lyase